MPNTPNFSLPYPTSTDAVDLVGDIQDLATAIETGVNTRAASTHVHAGQYSPVVHTHDFAAVGHTHDTSTWLDPAVVDAAGDLIVGTADNTPGRLAIGANGAYLTADSSTATGLKWAGTAPGYTHIGTVTATSNTNLLQLTGIPAGYKDLEIVYSLFNNSASITDTIQYRFNNQSTSNLYSYVSVLAFGSSSVGATDIEMSASRAFYTYNGLSSNWSRTGIVRITNYSVSDVGKAYTFVFGSPYQSNGGSAGYAQASRGAGITKFYAAITSVEAQSSTAFLPGAKISVYGLS